MVTFPTCQKNMALNGDKMVKSRNQAAACAWLCAAAGALSIVLGSAPASAAAPKAEVIHWWTSGGESNAVKQVAQAFRNAGGVWVDSAIAGGDQSRAVTINRIIGRLTIEEEKQIRLPLRISTLPGSSTTSASRRGTTTATPSRKPRTGTASCPSR